MRLTLRAAAAGQLERGWLFFAGSGEPTLDTPCRLLLDDEPEAVAVEQGFPQSGLDTETIEATTECARQFENPPTDELLLESFVYYWRFDTWLPYTGASDPPPWEEIDKMRKREFFEELGEERQGVPCRSEGCPRGAIDQSVFCRVHHYEMIKKEPCPFAD